MNNPSNQSGQYNQTNKPSEQKREARPGDKASQKPGSANVRPGSAPQNQDRR